MASRDGLIRKPLEEINEGPLREDQIVDAELVWVEDYVPPGSQKAPAHPLAWLARYWDRLCLGALLAAILAMIVYLLVPRPVATIALEPFRLAAPAVVTPVDETASDEAALSETETKPKRHYASHKKPAHPPITDINTAGMVQLQLLPGIGPKMAERVLEYRKQNGRFSSIDQIMDVKGIGPKKFEKMRPFIKV